MGQQDVIDALESLGGEARISEIINCIDSYPDTVKKLLRKMVKNGSVQRIRWGWYKLSQTYPALKGRGL